MNKDETACVLGYIIETRQQMNESYLVLKYGSMSEAVEAWIYNSSIMSDDEAQCVCKHICDNRVTEDD